jgi:glycosyltransferase involved in cell wall biosynthesis
MRKDETVTVASPPITVLQMLPELEAGGVERGTLEMGRYLVRHGHRSLVVSGGGRLVSQLEKEGSVHKTMQVGVKSPVSLKYILPLRRLLQRERVDVLHLRSRLPAWLGYLAWLSLPKQKRPVLVTTFHGFYSVNGYSAIMAKGDAVIAVSGAIREHIAESYGRTAEVTTIFRGVDAESFNPDSVDRARLEMLRIAWNLNENKPVVMLPGRISRWKGQDVFVRSLAGLENSNYQAVIVGDVEEAHNQARELRDLIGQTHLRERVKLVGHCQDMPAAYLLSDVVVSASSSEPEAFGRVSIEAMAMGRPVIATAHGGSLETVVQSKTGWLVKPADAADLTRALREALSLPRERLLALGACGRERVLRHFTTRAMCEQTLSVYQKWLRKRTVTSSLS